LRAVLKDQRAMAVAGSRQVRVLQQVIYHFR
jgi:hypothetical protein